MNQVRKQLKIELAKQKRVNRKMGLYGKMGTVLGGAGAVTGAVCGQGVLSGVLAVVGGSGGYIAGSLLARPRRKK
jgi:hypothetical protein